MSRNETGWDRVGSDVEKGPGGLFKWIFLAVIGVLVIGFVGNMVFGSAAKVGNVAVDRVVTKTSFQYKEGMGQRAAILQANIAQLDVDIARNPENVDDLIAQRKILSVQLDAITIND